MGNTKVYTFRCPLLGEQAPTLLELQEVSRSIAAMVSVVSTESGLSMIGMVESDSQSADRLIEFIRDRYPNRWCVFTRFDADYPSFRVYSWDEGDTLPTVSVAEDFKEDRYLHRWWRWSES